MGFSHDTGEGELYLCISLSRSRTIFFLLDSLILSQSSLFVFSLIDVLKGGGGVWKKRNDTHIFYTFPYN
jgi:hypothetical protein